MIKFFMSLLTGIVFFAGMVVGAIFNDETMWLVKSLGSMFTWLGS